MKAITKIFCTLLLSLFFGCQPAATRVGDRPVQPVDFKVIGYLPGRSVDTTSIPFKRLTHINFAFAIPAKNGGGLDALRNADKLDALVKAAHRHHLKVFISIGGWSIGDGGGDDSRFHRLAADPQERNYFVQNTMELVRRFDLDGVDVDWEYPDVENRSAEDNVLLMRQMGDSLHAINKELTAAVVHYGNQGEGTKDEIFQIVDWLNLMAYDDDKGQSVPHSPYSLAEKSINYWVKERGLPPHKAVLGLPFYGKPRKENLSHYKDLLAAGADPMKDEFDSVYYNGIATIKRKTELAKKEGLAGVMIWEIAQDTQDERSLLKAINEVIGKE
ncbi:MAG TPA: glycosyl hydrolase family 18 protein [Chryseosolibacter sp.]|nr:glycosyl hydrolase family 18 protein [Chryseosolibacter sp.]